MDISIKGQHNCIILSLFNFLDETNWYGVQFASVHWYGFNQLGRLDFICVHNEKRMNAFFIKLVYDKNSIIDAWKQVFFLTVFYSKTEYNGQNTDNMANGMLTIWRTEC